MPTVTFRSAVTAPAELMLLMMHPNDDALRHRDFVIEELDKLTQSATAEPLVLVRENARLLLDSPSLAEIKTSQKECTKQGFLAGRVLACLYLCDRFRQSHKYFVPSMNRAMYVGAYHGAHGATFGDGRPMPRSDKSIRDAWRKYAPVSHYWAAASMGGLGYPFAPERELFSPEWFGQFLGVSAALHRFGTSFIPDGAVPPRPVLDATQTWAPASDILPAELKSQRTPDVLKAILQTYRAPKSKPNTK